jgi:hypothetical protein
VMNAETRGDEVSGSPVSWTRRYEDLRGDVLVGDLSGGRSGFALFVRQGLVAWMRAFPRCPSSTTRSESPMQRGIAGCPSLPSSLRAQIVTVMVNMVLGGQQEVFQ